MYTSLIQIETGVSQKIIGRMVEAAEKIAGGSLATIHKRQQIPGLIEKLRDVITPYCIDLLRQIANSNDCIQASPNIRVHQPFSHNSIVHFHSDVLFGHSVEEINYWINLTPAFDTNSLWIVEESKTEFILGVLRQKMLPLAEFERLARETAKPIQAPSPGVHTFCCGAIHGSILNETDATRVSIDIRALGEGRRAHVKKLGSYFRPQWLSDSRSPLAPGIPVTTVASLDEPIPVYLQRLAMEQFYPQGPHRELIEFYGVPHNPVIKAALTEGPVIAYTVRQLKYYLKLREWSRLDHPIGFVDEGIWFTSDQENLLKRFMHEIRHTSQKAQT